LSKTENLLKNQNFGQKPTIWLKIKVLVKTPKSGKNKNFG